MAHHTYPLIKANIIDPNNADVFIHMNFDPNTSYIEKTHLDNGVCHMSSTIGSEVIELYKPKKVLIEPPRQWIKPHFPIPETRIENIKNMNRSRSSWTNEEHRAHAVKQLTSMYYSIFKCNELKEVYASEQGIHYDYVIRIRFDVTPKRPLVCSQYDPNFIYYQEMGQPDNLISDWINFGSSRIMNVYSTLFFTMDYYNSFTHLKKEDRQPNTLEPSEISAGYAEHFVRDMMHHHKIEKRGFNVECGLA
jgi:hypothetical protein